MIPALLTLTALAALMLAVLRHRATGRDGLYHCILWLSQAVTVTGKALYAASEGYARMRAGVDAAVLAGRQETARAWREAYDA
jgi:hypothetical protein